MIDTTPEDVQTVPDEIFEKLRVKLLARGSILANNVSVDGGLEFQVRAIIAEKLAAIEGAVDLPAVSVEYGDLPDLGSHGQRSAAMEMDPVEPLMAAELLFSIALPIIATRVATDGYPGREVDVAAALHHAIWRRFPPGATSRSSARVCSSRSLLEAIDEYANATGGGVLPVHAVETGGTRPLTALRKRSSSQSSWKRPGTRALMR